MKRRNFILLFLITLLLVFGLIILLIPHLINPSFYKSIIQDTLSSSIGREVYIGRAKISFGRGFSILFEDIRVKDKSFSFDLIKSKRVLLKIRLLPLLKREIKFREIIFDKPEIRLVRYKNGDLNFIEKTSIKDIGKEADQKIFNLFYSLSISSLSFQEGEIKFVDEALENTIEIKDFNLQISPSDIINSIIFRAKGKILQSHKVGAFLLSSRFENISERFDLKEIKSWVEVELRDIDIPLFWSYIKGHLPINKISGILNLNLNYSGKISGPFNIIATMKFKDLIFEYPRVFKNTLNPKWLNLLFNINYDKRDLNIQNISIELPEISVKARGSLYSIGLKDMRLDAEAQSNTFEISGVKKFIPYKILTPEVSEGLLSAEGKGNVQIARVNLSGKMSEIENCDKPQNNHVLSVELKLNGTKVKLPWNLPPFEDLKGFLFFKQGNLYLNNIEGRLLNSKFKNLNGIFQNLLINPSLSIQSEGVFNLSDINLVKDIVVIPKRFSNLLDNITSISGNANYQLSFRCNLKEPINLNHKGIYHISKIKMDYRKFPFNININDGRIDLSNEEGRISEAKVEFGGSSLLINGQWKNSKDFSPFEINLKGILELKSLLPLLKTDWLPEEIRAKTEWIESISGGGQISFKIRTLPNPPYYSYSFEFISRGVSFVEKGFQPSMVFKEGILSFNENRLTFSNTKFTFGKYTLNLNGNVNNEDLNLSILGSIDLKYLLNLFNLPIFPKKIQFKIKDIRELSGLTDFNLKIFGKIDSFPEFFREGKIILKGISLAHEKIPLPISNTEGSIILSHEKIQLEDLRGKIGNSQFELKGQIPKISTDKIKKISKWPLSLSIASKNLDFDLIFPPESTDESLSFKSLKDLLSIFSIDIILKVEEGKYRSLHYKDMIGEVKTLGEKLLINPFQSKLDEGDIWGEGWIEPTDNGLRFEIKPRISNVDLKPFLRTLLSLKDEDKILINGRLHIYKVELRGEGENFNRFKETLNGSLKLEVDNGIIERFNILSKIFSILNISQIFSGRLPDLKTKGLPYNKITANIIFRNGIAQTDDFLIDSDAMRITMVGKVDLSKNLIDAKIGIHPLVTVDKVLSNIPIVGYILTGKDKAFLSYFYEVKGDLDDPKIEAIPLKTLGESFFGIIKRLLEMPIKPFKKGSE